MSRLEKLLKKKGFSKMMKESLKLAKENIVIKQKMNLFD